ncbi:MAG: hypothetical protein A3K06_02090 [Candidatus Doudnabacteria bacterium RIFCSPHIGHO2_01_52_17]|uniref:Uncharacterized protein n=1 Tax=Candidatus Doudnabacteria bacterium RIFCSPHIGHO2_01_52_17 TaxID=1817820 RepID=A0A1F5NGJ0_9BACT|nr:MAG: hypothetical protein A3K06_02090 [Candidatus Doudnabacteria bacterium RIFCSPHIGHO2_01_52_17]
MTDSEPKFPYLYAALSAAFILVCVLFNYQSIKDLTHLRWVANLLVAIAVLALVILAAKWFARRNK